MRKDDVTAELPGVPKRRGRPPTGKAKSPAEYQREYRERKKAEGRTETTVTLTAEVLEAIKAYVARQNMDRAEQPITVGDAVDRIVRAYLLRKR